MCESKDLLEWLNCPLESFPEFEANNPLEGVFVLPGQSVLLCRKHGSQLVNPGADPQAVVRVISILRSRKSVLRNIFISQNRPLLVENLKRYQQLQKEAPELFSFTILAHEKDRRLYPQQNFVGLVNEEEFVKLDGHSFFLMKTPGNNKESAHMTILEMGHRLLFTGDLLQPQGESYEFATFVTPVPNHSDPESSNRSIQLLKSLPFEFAISAAGEFLDRSRAYRWMEITQKTLERISFYCRKVLWEEKSLDWMENARNVFMKISMERNMPMEALEKRFAKNREGLSDFELHDLPPIAYYLDKFGFVRPA